MTRARLRRALLRGWLFFNRSLTDRKEEALAWWDARRGYPWLRARFRRRLGYDMNLAQPQTMNEKVQWRKINDRRPVFSTITDKYAVRGYVAKKLGKKRAEALFPRLLGVTARPTEAWLRQCGTSVAFKANHGCGWNIILREGETPDYPDMLRKLRGWLRRRYGWRAQEWAYWGITPRIVAEELVIRADGRLADGLKLSVFRGKCGYAMVEHDQFGAHTQIFLTPDWQRLPLRMQVKGEGPDVPRPARYDEMLALAEELGRGLDFVRVDFLYTEDRFTLNELTLYRGSGLNPFKPRKYDRIFGDMWQLPGSRPDQKRGQGGKPAGGGRKTDGAAGGRRLG